MGKDLHVVNPVLELVIFYYDKTIFFFKLDFKYFVYLDLRKRCTAPSHIKLIYVHVFYKRSLRRHCRLASAFVSISLPAANKRAHSPVME